METTTMILIIIFLIKTLLTIIIIILIITLFYFFYSLNLNISQEVNKQPIYITQPQNIPHLYIGTGKITFIIYIL